MSPVEVAGGVVVNADGDILLVSGRFYSWSFPKGHVEVDEDILGAAIREIHEESGISQLEYISKLGSFQRTGGVDNKQFKNITIFLFRTNEKRLQPLDPKNPEARWVSREEVVVLLTRVEDKEFWLSIKGVVEKSCAKT